MEASDRTKTRVGAAAIAALLGVVLFSLLAGGFRFGDRLQVRVAFDEVGALQEGADVMIAGRSIGVVSAISPDRGGALAHLEIDSDYASWVVDNADAHIASKGLLSQRYIELGPPADGAEPGSAVANGATLRGVSPVRVEMVVLRSIENTKQFRELLVELRPLAAELGTAIDGLTQTLEELEGEPGRFERLRQSTGRLGRQISQLSTTLGGANISIDRLRAIGGRASRTSTAAVAYMVSISADLELLAADLERLQRSASTETLVKLGVALARAQRLVRDYRIVADAVSSIAKRIDAGKGTVGALLHDPEFIDEAKQLGRVIKRQPWRLFGTDRQRLDLNEP